MKGIRIVVLKRLEPLGAKNFWFAVPTALWRMNSRGMKQGVRRSCVTTDSLFFLVIRLLHADGSLSYNTSGRVVMYCVIVSFYLFERASAAEDAISAALWCSRW